MLYWCTRSPAGTTVTYWFNSSPLLVFIRYLLTVHLLYCYCPSASWPVLKGREDWASFSGSQGSLGVSIFLSGLCRASRSPPLPRAVAGTVLEGTLIAYMLRTGISCICCCEHRDRPFMSREWPAHGWIHCLHLTQSSLQKTSCSCAARMR